MRPDQGSDDQVTTRRRPGISPVGTGNWNMFRARSLQFDQFYPSIVGFALGSGVGVHWPGLAVAFGLQTRGVDFVGVDQVLTDRLGAFLR